MVYSQNWKKFTAENFALAGKHKSINFLKILLKGRGRVLFKPKIHPVNFRPKLHAKAQQIYVTMSSLKLSTALVNLHNKETADLNDVFQMGPAQDDYCPIQQG